MNSPRLLQFFTTPPQSCSYLPERESVSLFAEPGIMTNALYSQLARLGFRRSGSHVYRPACADCAACVPVRIPVMDFRPHRRDRRCRRRNADVETDIVRARYSEEYFALYQDYLSARHPRGGMDEATPANFRQFLLGGWSDTWFLEMRLGGHLVAVAVTDRLEDGLSAVYTFYDPALAERGLGSFAILQQIETARSLGLPYLYLGYWIAESRKMAYKGRFRPLQAYRGENWEALT
ncbi:MAG: arginyltransferase [Gammaproteobacteria bacterium]|nr:arginyltransferase [Gammaproteobacteria bacterium]